ncbi:Abhydrolase-3 domain-containing protein [Fusarium keratoplasticum]|nr:Abhydrolase-3 domain-containing protein [Fusarium keratoplasticum]
MAPALTTKTPSNTSSAHALQNPIDPSFLDRLDKDFIEYYNLHLTNKPATHSVSIADIRTNPKKYASPWCRDFSNEPFVKDIKIKSDDGHEITARCYHPDASKSPFGRGPYPVHINFHGGGFTFGDLTGDAELCMEWRNRLGIMVIDVNYRHCPENAFGKGHDDAWAAIRWVHRHGSEINIRPDSISIGGISAGGTLSAVAQQLARDHGLPLKLAVLAVPCTVIHDTPTTPEESPFASFAENALAPCLNWKRIVYFRDHWAPTTEEERAAFFARGEAFLSPLKGDLTGVCDTFVCTAGCDPLRDEGEQYGRRLVESGVKTTVRRYTGVPHPFMHMAGVRKAQMFMDDVTAELKRVHHA